MDSASLAELESWRVGELEIHAHLTAKKRHLSTGALRPGWDSNTLGTRFTRNFDFGFEVREAGACAVCVRVAAELPQCNELNQ